jgi:hypothetical protein
MGQHEHAAGMPAGVCLCWLPQMLNNLQETDQLSAHHAQRNNMHEMCHNVHHAGFHRVFAVDIAT